MLTAYTDKHALKILKKQKNDKNKTKIKIIIRTLKARSLLMKIQ